MRKFIYISLCILLFLSCNNAEDKNNRYEKKKIQQIFLADPYILLFEDKYYAYGTNAENGIEVYTSENLKEWKKSDKLALKKEDSYGDKWFWAPEVYYVNNKFYMYYSSEEHVCVAVSNSPLGPFKQKNKTPMIENEKTIDNTLFIDDDGKAYMFFDRFNDGLNIWVAQLENDLMTVKKETLKKCINVSQDWEKVWPRVNEGAFVMKQGQTYYMIYSANSYESQFYGIGYATANNIYGPWTKSLDNPVLQKPQNLVGVGHGTLFYDKDGNLRIVYHAHYNIKNIHPRAMYISDVEINNDNKMSISTDYLTPLEIK